MALIQEKQVCVPIKQCKLTRSERAEAAEGDVKFLEPGSSIVGRFVEQADSWQRFETLDFQLDVPPGFIFEAAPEEQPLPGAHFHYCSARRLIITRLLIYGNYNRPTSLKRYLNCKTQVSAFVIWL